MNYITYTYINTINYLGNSSFRCVSVWVWLTINKVFNNYTVHMYTNQPTNKKEFAQHTITNICHM